MRKGTKCTIQNTRSPSRGLNPGPPEYEVGVLTIRKQEETKSERQDGGMNKERKNKRIKEKIRIMEK
jgi:hypothetical protein